MRVIGYNYEADTHCVECTLKRFKAGGFSLTNPLNHNPGLDENGIDYRATDEQGNAVHPIFSTDEGDWNCGDCGECLAMEDELT